MMLCVDIGNSTVFMGLIDDGQVLKTLRVPVRSALFSEEILGFVDEKEVDWVGISSVVPDKTEVMVQAVRDTLHLSPLLVKRELCPSFPIALDAPDTLGADRVADATAAIRDHVAPVIVIDLGTATTFSVISREGVFLGGAICPGIVTSFNALTEKAAQLKDFRLQVPGKVIGTNTQDCISSGIIEGHASLIDGMVKRIEEETNENYKLILTGGMSTTVAPFCQHPLTVDETLILRGIYYMFLDFRAR